MQHHEYHGGSGVSGANPAGFDSDLDIWSGFRNVPDLLWFASRDEYAWSLRSI